MISTRHFIKPFLLCVFLMPIQSHCMLKLAKRTLLSNPSVARTAIRSFQSSRVAMGMKFQDVYLDDLFCKAQDGDKNAVQKLVDLQNNDFKLNVMFLSGNTGTVCFKESFAQHLIDFNVKTIDELAQKPVVVDATIDEKKDK